MRSGREALLSKPTRGHKVRFNSPVLPAGSAACDLETSTAHVLFGGEGVVFLTENQNCCLDSALTEG